MAMRGRERKLLKAALRSCYEAVAGLEVEGEGGGASSIASLTTALRAILDSQIAIMEALAAEEPAAAVADEIAAPAPAPPSPRPPAAQTNKPHSSEGEMRASTPQTNAVHSSEPAVPPGDVRTASGAVTRAALEAFELEDMNRWLGAGTGTVFQIRGQLAFLNMNALGGRIDEMRANIKRLGFSDELGKLDNDAVIGAVLLFKKPGG